MVSVIDEYIKETLASAQQLKINVDRIGEDFKNLRARLIESLQTYKPMNSLHGIITNHFQNMSDTLIDEHVNRGQPALVVFGSNSSNAMSFIEYLLGIGNILSSRIGSVTACIVQFIYASSKQASFRVYETIEKNSVRYEDNLSQFFENQLLPDWEGISNVLLSYIKHFISPNTNSPNFNESFKSFVEISLPSDVLSLGIDVYYIPYSLLNNQEQVLTDNLHKLVKRIKPTLVFVYDNAIISDTDKSCFLAMKNALGSMEHRPIFFLYTKASDLFDHDHKNMPLNILHNIVFEKRQFYYKLLRQHEIVNELSSHYLETADECTCFDICAIPEDYNNLINTNLFRRLVKFSVEAYCISSLALARDMLAIIDDYFDLVTSIILRSNEQWKNLLEETIKWSDKFFDEYQKLLPIIADELRTNILQRFDKFKPQIVRQAVLNTRTGDPIDALLQNKTNTIKNYIRLAVEEQVIKVVVNKVITTKRDQIKTLIAKDFQQQHGLRKNDLLIIAQQKVFNEIPVEVLQRTSLCTTFSNNLTKIPVKLLRFWRGLPTRLSVYYRDRYNQVVIGRIREGKGNVYQLLDAMDTCSTLSDETNRRVFADYCLTKLAKDLEEKSKWFGRSLMAWIEKQKNSFNNNLLLNFKHITHHLTERQTLHNFISKFSGPFAKLECQLLSVIELVKRNGIRPVPGKELGRGGFCSVHEAQWGSENNLVIKKLLRPTMKNEYMIALEAHYHRAITLRNLDHIAPLLHIYENNINDNRRELWLIMPRYPMSLRKYLMEHIHELSFARVISFAITIATALVELHRLEIIHGDIRASNIMLDDHEQCYIIDFGTVSFGLSSKQMLSTAFLQPKMIDTHHDGAAADIYSFGLLLYEMLPKASYERLDTDALSTLEKLSRLIPSSDIIRKSYEDQIRACLDPVSVNRPSINKLVYNLKLIQQSIEIKPQCTMFAI